MVAESRLGFATTVVPTQALMDGLFAALQVGPPEDDGSSPALVPLDTAPAGPPGDWPELSPDPSVSWVRYEDPMLGLQLEYPAAWSTYTDPASGAFSVASYPTTGGAWESIPDDGLRIDVRRLDRPGYFSATPLSIGRTGYLGSIQFLGLTGDTYHVYIDFEANSQVMQIAGYFKEPAELDNPNLRLFFGFLARIAIG